MSKMRQALRERRHYKERLLMHQRDAATASYVLHAEYRKHSFLVLTAASMSGFLTGRFSDRIRPPRPLLRSAFSWSMLLMRGLL